jgi:hypothetical protein
MQGVSSRKGSAAIATIVFVCCAVVGVYLVFLRYEAGHGRVLANRWLSDDHDRDAYFERAQFLPTKRVPYLEVRSEYPTLATLFFATPLLPSPGFQVSKEEYRFRWSCIMAAFLVATVWLVARFRVRHGLGAAPALVMLAPSPLYFALMRFDILCAFVLCLSLDAFCRARYRSAHFLLAVGTLLKWYPALVFPVYAAFHVAHEPPWSLRLRDALSTRTVRYCAVFVATVAVLVVGSVVAFTWDGFLVPYVFHARSGGQYFNAYWLLEQKRTALGIDRSGWKIVQAAFLALEFSIVPILLLKRIRSPTDVFRYAILAIALFITFSRIDSPQWILWYLPPALMFVRDRRTVVALTVLAFWTYLVFPVAYGAWGPHSLAFSSIVLVKDLVLLAAVACMLWERGPDEVVVSRRSTTIA